MGADILIVDDESDIRDLVAGILEDEGHSPRLAGNSDEAIAAIESRRPQLLLLDIWLQGSKLDGLQLLETVKKSHPNVPVVMISGHGNIETAVTAIKLGAYDFIEKPFKADRLILIAERALETSRLKREVQDLIEARMRGIVEGIAATFDMQATLRYERRYPATVNSAQETVQAARAAAAVVGEARVERAPVPEMTSEDFAFMLQAKPGCYVWLGAGASADPPGLHNPRYDFNDNVLPIGASYWVTLAEQQLPLRG